MEVRRGDLVTISLPGAYGKPRPALVIQDDGFSTLPSITVIPLTSMLNSAPLLRVTVQPGSRTGLQQPSQAMVDKIMTVPRSKIGQRIGELDGSVMKTIEGALSRFLGLRLTP